MRKIMGMECDGVPAVSPVVVMGVSHFHTLNLHCPGDSREVNGILSSQHSHRVGTWRAPYVLTD